MRRNLKFRPTCSIATFGENGCFEPQVSTVSVSDCAEEVVVVDKDSSVVPLPQFRVMHIVVIHLSLLLLVLSILAFQLVTILSIWYGLQSLGLISLVLKKCLPVVEYLFIAVTQLKILLAAFSLV